MSNDKNEFAIQLQEQIGQKRISGISGVNWFSGELSRVTKQTITPTNVYKWLSGTTAREVPAKFIKRKPGEAQDFISQALNLTVAERVRLLDSFYLTYAYDKEKKDTLLHLLDSTDLEALGDYGRFKILSSKDFSKTHNILVALNKYFACIDCVQEESSVAIKEEKIEKASNNAQEESLALRICATDKGFLEENRLDAFLSLLGALYAAEVSVEVILCFGAKAKTNKIRILKRLFSIVFDNGVSARKQDLFSLKVLPAAYVVQPFDSITLGDGTAGYCLTKDNAYLTWCDGVLGRVFEASYARYSAQSLSPFVVQKVFEIPAHAVCIANDDAPLYQIPTYVLGECESKHFLIASNSPDRLGDNWVRYSYVLDEDDNVYLVPYYLDDYVDVPSLAPLKRALSTGKKIPGVAICDPDLVAAIKVYKDYLDEISARPQSTGESN